MTARARGAPRASPGPPGRRVIGIEADPGPVAGSCRSRSGRGSVPSRYAGRRRASAAAPGGVRGRGIAATGHGGGSSSSSLRRERGDRRRVAGPCVRRPGARLGGTATARSSWAKAASTASTGTGSALEPVRQRRPGALSTAQASDAQDARIALCPRGTGAGAPGPPAGAGTRLRTRRAPATPRTKRAAGRAGSRGRAGWGASPSSTWIILPEGA